MEISKSVFVIQPISPEFDAVFQLIAAAARTAGAKAQRIDQVAIPGSIIEQMYEAIENCDVIVCDTTNSSVNVLYQLGYAHGIKKPTILISQGSGSLPFDLTSVRSLRYDVDFPSLNELSHNLEALIQEALQDPERFSARPRTSQASTVFVSYSHRDNEFLERLRIHLKPLERRGLMDLWDDSKIAAGDQWKAVIEEALGKARIALLLLSADFLASDFIVENELPPLLVKAEAEGTRILPIIVRPCRFLRDRNLNRFQAINDPKSPLSSMSESEQERLYDEISNLVEQNLVDI